MYEHRGYTFTIEMLEKHLYAIAKKSNKLSFCIPGISKKECQERACKAIDFYIECKPQIDTKIKNM